MTHYDKGSSSNAWAVVRVEKLERQNELMRKAVDHYAQEYMKARKDANHNAARVIERGVELQECQEKLAAAKETLSEGYGTSCQECWQDVLERPGGIRFAEVFLCEEHYDDVDYVVDVLDATTRILAREEAEEWDHDLLTETEGDALERLIGAHNAALEDQTANLRTALCRTQKEASEAEAEANALRCAMIETDPQNPVLERTVLRSAALDAALEQREQLVLEELCWLFTGKEWDEIAVTWDDSGPEPISINTLWGHVHARHHAALEQAMVDLNRQWRDHTDVLLERAGPNVWYEPTPETEEELRARHTWYYPHPPGEDRCVLKPEEEEEYYPRED